MILLFYVAFGNELLGMKNSETHVVKLGTCKTGHVSLTISGLVFLFRFGQKTGPLLANSSPVTS